MKMMILAILMVSGCCSVENTEQVGAVSAVGAGCGDFGGAVIGGQRFYVDSADDMSELAAAMEAGVAVDVTYDVRVTGCSGTRWVTSVATLSTMEM